MQLKGSSVFSVGSDLWVFADPEHSSWTRKIDWHLNGLLTRAEHRTPQTLSPALLQILKSEDSEIPKVPKTSGTLLISSSLYLPNRQTVVLQYSGVLSTWVKSLVEVWRDLNEPTIRVFLPADVSVSEFNKHWDHKDSLTIVESED